MCEICRYYYGLVFLLEEDDIKSTAVKIIQFTDDTAENQKGNFPKVI